MRSMVPDFFKVKSLFLAALMRPGPALAPVLPSAPKPGGSLISKDVGWTIEMIFKIGHWILKKSQKENMTCKMWVNELSISLKFDQDFIGVYHEKLGIQPSKIRGFNHMSCVFNPWRCHGVLWVTKECTRHPSFPAKSTWLWGDFWIPWNSS